MSDTLTKVIVDCSTGETTVVPLNTEELAQLELDRAEAEAERLAKESAKEALDALKASAKAKLVAGEPLTSEEADTLVL